LDVSESLSSVFELFPLVVSGSAPTANFGGGILRLIGPDVSNAADLLGAFQVGGGLDTLSISSSENAIIISADSQNTGEDQSMFSVESHGGEIFVMELATFEGNALDIDHWHADNFSFIA
jgi:hypothetical protein